MLSQNIAPLRFDYSLQDLVSFLILAFYIDFIQRLTNITEYVYDDRDRLGSHISSVARKAAIAASGLKKVTARMRLFFWVCGFFFGKANNIFIP
ncbi:MULTISPECIES: hypothetical protein [Spirulina sp. CCY15215]|uniref:hypothetical protein n=1 Tax=Spirulina sp. CCY15215 TaxID=2767591 RepID=UPI00194FBF03|nr:hypothetical protein [Spirulina major]